MGSIPPPTSGLAYPGATLVGKYRLESLVGYGGMGSVWAATHLGLGHQIAIKLISQQHLRSTDVRRRFDTEAKAVARLKSRHVVQIYDNGELEDGTPYIAMELLTGESLHRRIHRAGPMQIVEAVTVLTQVCRALSRAHAAGIIHRDIKPDNIFLANSEEDGGYVTKVLDFGVAKLALQEGEQSSTQTGSLVGTPLYMSPEQARGLKTIDHRTDLYSLALVAYTMFTGNLAFSGDSFGDLILKICTQEPPSLLEAAPWLPPGVDGWFRKAAAREPDARHQSAQEFADALGAAGGVSVSRPGAQSGADVSAGFPPQAGRPEPGALAESIAKPHAAPVLQARSHGGTMTGATLQAETDVGAHAARKGGRAAVFVAASLVGVLVLGGGALLVLGRRGAPPVSVASAPPTTAAPLPAPPRPELGVAPSEPAPAEPPTPNAAAAPAPSATTAPPTSRGREAPLPSKGPAQHAPQASSPVVPPPKAAPTNKPPKPNSGNVDLGY
jgi:hypothetical protein